MKSLKNIGEFGLIGEIKKMVRSRGGVRVGIGDDAAVVRMKSGKELLFTTDMLVEGRHFKLNEAMPEEIGRKALAVNVSDIAAMGGEPTHAVVALGLPEDATIEFVRGLYRGMETLARQFKISLVGGDTNRSDRLVLSVALLGEVPLKHLVRRSGARPGDVIFVTNSLGGSYATRKHLNFTPRVREARFLVENFKINAMIDLSDGLASDIRRIAEASKVGAVISRTAIPVAPAAKGVEAALTEGEDFELLLTMSPHEAARLTLHPRSRRVASFHPVGKILKKKYGVLITRVGAAPEPLLERGYEHFK